MKKKLIGLAVLGGTAALTLASCGQPKDVFHIYAWNTEFQGFFNKYVSDEKNNDEGVHHLDGKEVKWTIVTSDDNQYQNSLDVALQNNANANTENKVDMFLAEADYILKYAGSDYTKDVKTIGVTNFSNAYQYTVDAASDANGVVKGASFQCCPSGMVYRRDIAQEVLGVSTPEEIQPLVDNWEKWENVAAQMKAAGYLMTASYADSYRVFSNNAATPWVVNNKVTIPAAVEAWMTQAEKFVKEGYTKVDGVWDDGKTAEFTIDGKAFCTFGPAWYYNFCMGTAMGSGTPSTAPTGKDKNDAKNSYGKWGLVEGPQAHFWGGTWMLATTAGDDDALVAKTMNAFLNDTTVCTKLVKDEAQFSNNKAVNQAVATEYTNSNKGNGFLAGQNDTAIWVSMAGNIKFKNITNYDQQCNEGLQTSYVKYLKDELTSKEAALNDFKSTLSRKFPTLTIE